MLFYERLSKESKDEDHIEETTTCYEQSDDIPNIKVDLTKDLADVSRWFLHTSIEIKGPILSFKNRVPTAPGKPGKMTIVFPVLEKYWDFIILLKILERWE